MAIFRFETTSAVVSLNDAGAHGLAPARGKEVMVNDSLRAMNEARTIALQARNAVVLTGAGISAESGIPTFRDAPTSLWSEFDPEALATADAWRRDPALVWGWYLWRMGLVRAAQPNAGHLALASVAQSRELRVITQNVDDLHERAGSIGVVHLHGSLFAHRCFACARPHGEIWIPPPGEVPLRVEPPRCAHCGGRVRPGVVWFGESLPERSWHAAVAAVMKCDLLLVVGTSGIVNPAAALPAVAKRNGTTVVEVNPVATPLSALADVCVRESAASALPSLFQ